MKKILVLLTFILSTSAFAQNPTAGRARENYNLRETAAENTPSIHFDQCDNPTGLGGYIVAGELRRGGNKFCSFPKMTLLNSSEKVEFQCGEHQAVAYTTFTSNTSGGGVRTFIFKVYTAGNGEPLTFTDRIDLKPSVNGSK